MVLAESSQGNDLLKGRQPRLPTNMDQSRNEFQCSCQSRGSKAKSSGNCSLHHAGKQGNNSQNSLQFQSNTGKSKRQSVQLDERAMMDQTF